jgi:hypothetical protein
MTKVGTTDSYRIPGIYEPMEYIVEMHTICDECGSTDISYKGDAHLPEAVRTVFVMVFFISLLGFIGLAFGAMALRLFKYNLILCGIGMISVIDILVFSFLTDFIERNNDKNPKCNKCGNEHIT